MPSKFKEVFEFIKENIKEDETVIIACSGGPDSMCLLDMLIKYREKTNINIILAHVHHNVRKESDDELLFVSKFAKKNNIIFESMKINNYSKNNFESEARDKRYTFFTKLQNKYNAKYLLTAHHGDDLMETILMRLVRGSNLKGYAGVKRVSYNGKYYILRPLLTVTKKDILEYNKKYDIPYVNDYTNDLDIHTRNRYRKYILPKLKEENELVNLKFLKFSDLLTEYDSYVSKVVEKILGKIYLNNVLDIDKYSKCDELIKTLIINKILSDIYNDNIIYVSDKNVSNIKKLLSSDAANANIDLPKGYVACKSYNNFYITKKALKDDYEYVFKDKVTLPNGKRIEKVNDIDSNSNFVCRISSKDIKLPLIVRNRKNGDFIEVMNMKGHKKLKDIFIDSKIPMRERTMWPVVTDSLGNIIWVPGLKKTKYNKQINEKCDIILRYY